MSKVDVGLVVELREQAGSALQFKLVPAHMGDAGVLGKPLDHAGIDTESGKFRGFFAALEEGVQAEADSEEGDAGCDALFEGFADAEGIERADELTEVPDAGQDNLVGAAKAGGRDFFSAGIGFRWQARENVSVGLTWEVPLESPSENLMEQRVTLNTVISF